MDFTDKELLKQMSDEYYNRNFKKSKKEVNIFIEKQLKKAMCRSLNAYFRFFLLENAMYKYKDKNSEENEILEILHSVCDGFNFITENLSKISLKEL